MTLGVLDGARFVCARASRVAIDEQALGRLAADLLPAPRPEWDPQHHFFDGTARTVTYLFLVDALNFCFFPEPRWQVIVDGERLQGYFALTSILTQAFERGRPADDFRRLSQIDETEVRDLLQGPSPIGTVPLLTRRAEILREVGRVVVRSYGGDPSRLVAAAGGSAKRLVSELIRSFPSFRDEATYGAERIPFHKRAQIFASDLAGSFAGRSFGAFADLPSLTAFADYKIPQILRACGALRYSPELAARVDRKDWIPPGSPEEVEIRASTVWAVELLRQELGRRGRPLLSIEIDWLLWNAAQRRDMAPHHCTLTTAY